MHFKSCSKCCQLYLKIKPILVNQLWINMNQQLSFSMILVCSTHFSKTFSNFFIYWLRCSPNALITFSCGLKNDKTICWNLTKTTLTKLIYKNLCYKNSVKIFFFFFLLTIHFGIGIFFKILVPCRKYRTSVFWKFIKNVLGLVF